MTVKEKYRLIKDYEKNLNEIVSVIEIFDPIRNDTTANDYIEDGVEMVRIPVVKSWIVRLRKKIFLRVERRGGFQPVELEFKSIEVIDSISESLCKQRDWYRGRIEELNK